MPIDYSKWDNIDVSDSDGSDSDGGEGRGGEIAKVTRLDAPSSVTFGGGGGGGSSSSGGNTAQQQHQTITVTTPSPNTQDFQNSQSSEKQAPSSSASLLPSAGPTQAVAQPAPATQTTSNKEEEKVWTDTGGSCYIPVVVGVGDPSTSDSSRQQQQRKVYWSQDRYSVTITIELFDDEMKIRSVHVDGIVSYKDRFSATLTDTSSKPRLRIVTTTAAAAAARVPERSTSSSRSSRTIVDDELPYPVHLAEEDEDSDSDDMKNDGDGKGHSIDWTIVRKTEPQPGQGQPTAISKRYVQVTLYKAVPMYGMFFWWRRPFMQCPEVDIKHDSKKNSSKSGDTSTNTVGTTTNGNEEFLEAWNQAHKIFKDNIKDRKNQPPP